MPWLLLLLPWLELWSLIELGAATSALAALGWVFLSLVMGLALIRRQGEGMLRRAQQLQSEGGFIGAHWLLDDMALVGAGLLLMVPGLLTDGLALLVAVGPLRRALGRLLGLRVVEAGHFRPDAPVDDPEGPTTLEGDYRRLDD